MKLRLLVAAVLLSSVSWSQVSAFTPSMLIYVQQNPDQNPRPSNPANLSQEYLVKTFDQRKETVKVLGKIRGNYFKPNFQIAGDILYFVDDHGKIAMFNIKKGAMEKKTYAVPPLDFNEPDYVPADAYPSIADFLVLPSKKTVAYLYGDCGFEGEEIPCSLMSLTLKDGKHRTVKKNIQRSVQLGMFGTIFFAGVGMNDSFAIVGASGDHAEPLLYKAHMLKGTVTPLGDSSKGVTFLDPITHSVGLALPACKQPPSSGGSSYNRIYLLQCR